MFHTYFFILVHLQASHFPQFSVRRHPVHSPQRLEDFFSILGSQGASYSYRCPPSFSLYFLCFLSSWSVLRGLYRVIKVESSSLQRCVKIIILIFYLYYFDQNFDKNVKKIAYNTEKLFNMFCIFFSYVYAITMVPFLACVTSSETI